MTGSRMEIKGEKLELDELVDPPHEVVVGTIDTIGDKRDPVEIIPLSERLPVEVVPLAERGRSHRVPLFERVPVEVTPLLESEPVEVEPVDARMGEWIRIVRSVNRLTSGVWMMRKWSI